MIGYDSSKASEQKIHQIIYPSSNYHKLVAGQGVLGVGVCVSLCLAVSVCLYLCV